MEDKAKKNYYEVTELMDNLRVSMKKLSRCDNNPFRKVDFRVLHTIKDNEELTMQELGEEMGITKSRVTAIISKMVEKNLIETISKEDDRRKKILKLTENGEKQIEEFKRRHEEIFMRMWEKYSDEEITQWKYLMSRMVDIIEDEVKQLKPRKEIK